MGKFLLLLLYVDGTAMQSSIPFSYLFYIGYPESNLHFGIKNLKWKETFFII